MIEFIAGSLVATLICIIIVSVYIETKEENERINREGKELLRGAVRLVRDSDVPPVEKRIRQRRGTSGAKGNGNPRGRGGKNGGSSK